MKKPKGKKFEDLTKEFFKDLFGKCGYQVLEARNQKSGTQNGFDVLVRFLDRDNNEKRFHIECKDYSQTINWTDLLTKIHELDSSAYIPDAFIGISPKSSISNVNHNSLEKIKTRVKFPIELWSPDSSVDEIFALNKEIYNEIYENDAPQVNSKNVIIGFKSIIENILQEKRTLCALKKILIKECNKDPKERKKFKINLDKKLDTVLDEDDPIRIEYHKLRCDYKVFIEELQDVNNELRSDIINWQNDLRLLASRLTRKFKNDSNYNSTNFFNDFFKEAERRLYLFFQNEKYSGDFEKLLNGIVFELAAECPLDWSCLDE